MIKRYYLPGLDGVEICFYVQLVSPLPLAQEKILRSLLCRGLSIDTLVDRSVLAGDVLEIGPRLTVETSWSSNMVSICKTVGLTQITRLEFSRRFPAPLSDDDRSVFIAAKCDRMTEQIYTRPLESFDTGVQPKPLAIIRLMENGRDELKKISIAAFDQFEIDLIYDYFINVERRNPTEAEILDWANANSEHCRHWIFRGNWVLNGIAMTQTLFQLVKFPWIKRRGVSLFAFDDNSGAIHGRQTQILRPGLPTGPSLCILGTDTLHFTQTAETHNFPTGVSPKGGAETGLGGMQRDQRCVRQGAVPLANLSGYAVGNLYLDGYNLPWEEKRLYLPNLATPLEVLIDGSGGVHHYGNESGVPLTVGFCRSTDLVIDGQRWAFQKPILYAGGVGHISQQHISKNEPKKGMLIVQVGGPAYRIGVGGGAASSKAQGDQSAELDFNAVQRGNAEMSHKVDRVVYSCISMRERNPIVMAHDQGAGGMANAVKEAVGSAGGRIDIRKVNVGDSTMSVWEIYVAEYQERECFVLMADRLSEFVEICVREKAPFEILGKITGDGRFVVEDSQNGSVPVDIDLQAVLGDLPPKTFTDSKKQQKLDQINLNGVTIKGALFRVLRLLSVGSKRFLVKNVDRSVKGLTVQQQCCGPLQLPVADCGISTSSHFGKSGVAYSLGEKSPILLGNATAGARMSVCEAILNMAGADVGSIKEIACRANWMWSPKLAGEGYELYQAALAMSELLVDLGINITGGKDSSSMNCRFPDGSVVISPRELVILATAVQKHINRKASPDFKNPGSLIFHLDLAKGLRRLGGSALAQVNQQIGNEFPDLVDLRLFKSGFSFVQDLLRKDLLLACHDISDGGLVTTVLEMGFSGNLAFEINNLSGENTLSTLFAEELGLVLEINPNHRDEVISLALKYGIKENFFCLGKVNNYQEDRTITIFHHNRICLMSNLDKLRSIWEETSYHLDLERTNQEQAEEEWQSTQGYHLGLTYNVSFEPRPTSPSVLRRTKKPRVAVLRDEGTNGDEEMRAAFYSTGFEVVDLHMTDLLSGKTDLKSFRGLAAAGGFSYGDVPESAKGEAATIRYNNKLREMFDEFYRRPDTFSLGVCNGAQLLTMMGWVPYYGLPDDKQPLFTKNLSGIFESRWSMVEIQSSPSILFKGMTGSRLGVWVAHGEGLLNCPDPEVLDKIQKQGLVPLVFVDEYSQATTKYPDNPNGSPFGITSLCNHDGRHTAMMPHPERCFLKWQWPYLPQDLSSSWQSSPWLKMFQNAYDWCLQH